MMKDPYEILGIAKNASQDEVRKAYRKLAKESHPDLHPGDHDAERKFRDATAAYDLLGDPAKRIRFDHGEIDADGHEMPQQQFYRQYADSANGHRYDTTAGFEDFADISDFFGSVFSSDGRSARGSVRMKGRDVHYRLAIDFLEAVRGARKRVTMPDGKTIDLSVPAGTVDGQTLRLKGKGQPGVGGGPAGDAFVEIEVRQHSLFTRKGDDIVIELPISIDEAILGARIPVPTVDGTVSMTIPKGSTSGQVLRLRGKGVHRGTAKSSGDQLVTLKIVMPPSVDPDLSRFMETWRAKHGYDPRRGMKGTS